MSWEECQEKKRYFEELELQSDDENKSLGEGFFIIGRALAEVEAMAPRRVPRGSGSFLGPTMKEAQKEWAAQAVAESFTARSRNSTLKRSWTEPDSRIADPDPISIRKRGRTDRPVNETPMHAKRTVSMSSLDTTKKNHPNFMRIGAIPRELRKGKNVKLAETINMEPRERQLFRDKVIYMYPNDDISMARRYRIHKLIQLGAAWVTTWQDGITHIIVDDGEHTYSQLLRHFNKAGLPKHVVLVKFDPYVPQCIQFGRLLDPTAGRFLVKGAPRPAQTESTVCVSDSIILPNSAQNDSLPSPRRTSPTKNQPSLGKQPANSSFASKGFHASSDEIVKDSFTDDNSKAPAHTHNDALSAAIEEAKAMAHLPLDEEHDDNSRPSSSGSEACGSETDEESEPAKKRPRSFGSAPKDQNPPQKRKPFQNTFACMDPAGRSSSQNPNARTIEVLDQMCKYYDQMHDQFRTLAYRRAITTLRKQDTKITTSKQAAALPAIGSRIADKIEEIVLTDGLRRLDSTRDDPTDQVLRLFLGVYGAGLTQASKWIQAGHRTLDDLVTKAKLTPSQKIGIEHYTDFAQRIPRAEVEAHGKTVRNALHKLDPGFQVMIMGSYRRGARDSGDIDLIISKPGASILDIRAVVFGKLIPSLSASGFLRCKLATSSRSDDGSKWHGASCLPSSTTWRRLDLLLVPDYEMGAALIYFTGNDIFNRSMRLLASKKGMRLNQRGLHKDVVRGKNRERMTEGTLVEGRSERRIFEILGVPWREPTERIC